MRESRDSLREEISQNLNENLTEHEVVTETVIYPSAGSGQAPLKIERITDRVRTLESGSKRQDSRVVVRTEVVRDTVYVERVDTVEVQKLQGTSSSLNPHPSALRYLKWIFALICAVVVLIITMKVCLRR